jgi:homoserine kinase
VRVHVRVPATSANLGAGFDAFGLALALHNEIGAAEGDGVAVAIDGYGGDRLPTDERNLVARGVKLAYQAAGRSFPGCALSCVNRIPPARGLGSSAAAWVGGLVAGNALLGSPLDRTTLLTLAARSEGHPDNVAAALLGGLTVSCARADDVTAISLPVPSRLRWVVLIPRTESSTAEARALLPASVPRGDAIFNIQRVALFLAGLQSHQFAALAWALDDRLHQPYRLPFFPWMGEVIAATRAAGALGCVLSGAGPSLLAVTADDAGAVARAMEAALRKAGVDGTARELAVDTTGTTSHVVPADDPSPRVDPRPLAP